MRKLKKSLRRKSATFRFQPVWLGLVKKHARKFRSKYTSQARLIELATSAQMFKDETDQSNGVKP